MTNKATCKLAKFSICDLCKYLIRFPFKCNFLNLPGSPSGTSPTRLSSKFNLIRLGKTPPLKLFNKFPRKSKLSNSGKSPLTKVILLPTKLSLFTLNGRLLGSDVIILLSRTTSSRGHSGLKLNSLKHCDVILLKARWSAFNRDSFKRGFPSDEEIKLLLRSKTTKVVES